jgi:hypothetical protein
MDCTKRWAIELHPNNRSGKDGFCLSKPWKPLSYSLKECRTSHDEILHHALRPTHSLYMVLTCPSLPRCFLLSFPITLPTAPFTLQVHLQLQLIIHAASSHLPPSLQFSNMAHFRVSISFSSPFFYWFSVGFCWGLDLNQVFSIWPLLLTGLLFWSEKGGTTFFQSITNLLSDYMASHLRRQYSTPMSPLHELLNAV